MPGIADKLVMTCHPPPPRLTRFLAVVNENLCQYLKPQYRLPIIHFCIDIVIKFYFYRRKKSQWRKFGKSSFKACLSKRKKSE